jgi:hypothetical protein
MVIHSLFLMNLLPFFEIFASERNDVILRLKHTFTRRDVLCCDQCGILRYIGIYLYGMLRRWSDISDFGRRFCAGWGMLPGIMHTILSAMTY